MKAEVYKGISKKTGKEFKAIKVTIGVYEGILFPSPAEVIYIENHLRQSAHSDFQEGLVDVSEG